MILILEQDVRSHNGKWFSWRPRLFVGKWSNGCTFRWTWGLWSISFYSSPGLKDFFDKIKSGGTHWRDK